MKRLIDAKEDKMDKLVDHLEDAFMQDCSNKRRSLQSKFGRLSDEVGDLKKKAENNVD